MNKTAIKNFAIWARKKLRDDIILKAGLLGITEKEIADPMPQSTDDLQLFDIGTSRAVRLEGRTAIEQRESLVKVIRTKQLKHAEAFDAVIEEVAYTWFNRLIAVRFMEVNDYLPSRVRVVSSENPAKAEPDFVTNPFDTDLDFTEDEINLIDDLKDRNKSDELFQFLFIKQCNKLNEILPELFEKTNDYTELLLNVSFTDKDGVVYHLVNDIKEEDFNIGDDGSGQVEMIGWLYQFYNEERKNQVINIQKSIVKKQDIPAATQLFTTDWVVRYIVDNSLGRYWIERNPESKLAQKLDYFVLPKNGQITYVDEKIDPQDIKLLDPCMGSAHFLVYAFDVLMAIYEEKGYSQRDAAILIAEKNLYGLEIDKRAYQLAFFAVMMKVRRYNRRAFTEASKPELNLTYIKPTAVQDEPYKEWHINTDFLKLYSEESQNTIIKIFNDFKEGDELGSIILPSFSQSELTKLKEESQLLVNKECKDIYDYSRRGMIKDYVYPILKQAEIIIRKYDIVVTNPPFLNKMDKGLKKYVNDNFKDYGADLFSVFIYRNFNFCKLNGYSGFMTPYVWMFIKTYEKLRNYLLTCKAIVTLIQMEYSAFEEATVPICSFVLRNGKEIQDGLYIRLTDFKGGMEVQRIKVLEALAKVDCNYIYVVSNQEFKKIQGKPISFWAPQQVFEIFESSKKLGDVFEVRNGITTADNDHFLRYWYEISFTKFNNKWFPCNKGGTYKKWYGNLDYVVDWENDGYNLKHFFDKKGKLRSTLRSIEYNFQEAITMSRITSSKTSFRWLDKGFITEGAANNIYFRDETNAKTLLGFLNSVVSEYIIGLYNQTINLMPDEVRRIPIQFPTRDCEENVDFLIALEKNDWDSFETSWDFKKHPLI